MHTCGTAEGVACLQQLKSGYAGITTGSCDVSLALARAVLGIALCGCHSTSSVTPTGCAAVREGEREGRSEIEEEGREKWREEGVGGGRKKDGTGCVQKFQDNSLALLTLGTGRIQGGSDHTLSPPPHH